MRKPIIAANWKMHKTPEETADFLRDFIPLARTEERVDIVIASTGAPHAIVHRHDVEKARRARKYRPLFFIDIAVPRDIEPSVGDIEEVYLYDIDTLEQLAEEARGRRQQQIDECERIIEAELAKLNLPGT